MRKYYFLIDNKGIEAWFPADLPKGTPWFGGSTHDRSMLMIRAVANQHRGAYYLEADINEETEKQLVKLVGKGKHWIKGKTLIEKYTGKSFKTESLSKENAKLFFDTLSEQDEQEVDA
jgi:hypothetical protein